MNVLQRQFGPRFVQLVLVSPRLVADIKRLRRRGVRIKTLRGSIDAWCIKDENLIALDTGNPAQAAVMALAHEANHMLRERISLASVNRVSEAHWVREFMEEETDCFFREAETAEDFARAGIKLTKYAQSWLRTKRRGGKAAVRRRVYRTKVIGTKLTYPEYIRQMYRQWRTAA